MGPGSLSINKITRPTLAKVLARPRLFRLLDQAGRSPITWISGPPGSGKTTLIADYLDQRKLPCLWYRVDEGDMDLSTFFYYTGLAGRKAAPRSKKPLPLLTPEYQLGIPTFTRRYFEALYQRLKPPYILIFDNYQTIAPDAAFHEIIQKGLTEIPDGIRVIIISRADPPPVYSRLRANRLLHTIGWEELRLTPAELKGVTKLHDKKSVSQTHLQYLHERTQGWMAGVVLLKRLKKEAFGPSILNGRMPESIFDYFAGEIFDRMDQELQEFLLKTACLPRMTPRMAEQLTGNSRADRILAELNRKNYFVEKHSHPELSYQYHALFREFLLAKIKTRFAVDEVISLSAKAAEQLESMNASEEALELYTQINSWPAAAGLIAKQALQWIKQGRYQFTIKWINRLPKEWLENEPWLFFWLSVSLMPFDPAKGRLYGEKAYALFKQKQDAAGCYLSWTIVVQSFGWLRADFLEIDHWLANLNELLRDFPKPPNAEIEGQFLGSFWLAVHTRRPDHPLRAEIENRIWINFQECQEPDTKNMTASILLHFYAWWGDFDKARKVIQLIQADKSSSSFTPLRKALWNSALSLYLFLNAEFEECQKTVQQGLALAQNSGIAVNYHFLLDNGVCSALSAGKTDLAAEYFKRWNQAVDQGLPIDKAKYQYALALETYLQSDWSRALDQMRVFCAAATSTGMQFITANSHLGIASVLLELGKNQEVPAHLKRIDELAKQLHSPLVEFDRHLLWTRFFFREGAEVQGLNHLQKALSLGREKGYLNTLWWHPDIMARLCGKALEAGIEVEYSRQLIRKRHLRPDASAGTLETWPWPIKIYTLGRFEIRIDDRPIAFTRKMPKKQLEALKILIAAEKKELRVEHLMDILWPQADGDLANKSLTMTLQRLRQLIKYKDALVLDKGRLYADRNYFWVDAWAFEKLQQDAVQESGPDRMPNLGALQKALSLYRGTFLPGDPDQEWAVAMRERLRNRFIDLVERIGISLEQSGDLRKAAKVYADGLEVDNLAEVFYRRLMRVYRRLGRLEAAVTLYKRCEKNLANAFGLAPGSETQTLYKTIANKTEKQSKKSPTANAR